MATTSDQNNSAASAPLATVVAPNNMFGLSSVVGYKTHTGTLLWALPSTTNAAGKKLMRLIRALSADKMRVVLEPAQRAARGAQVLDAELVDALSTGKVHVALGLPNGLVYDPRPMNIDHTPLSQAARPDTPLGRAVGAYLGAQYDSARWFTSLSRWFNTVRAELAMHNAKYQALVAKLPALRGDESDEACRWVRSQYKTQYNAKLYCVASKFADNGAPDGLALAKCFTELTKGQLKRVKGKSGAKRKARSQPASSSSSAASAAPVQSAAPPPALPLSPPPPPAQREAVPAATPVADIDNNDASFAFFDAFGDGDDDFFDDALYDEDADVAAAVRSKKRRVESVPASPVPPPPLEVAAASGKIDWSVEVEPERVGVFNVQRLLSTVLPGAFADSEMPGPMDSFIPPPAPARKSAPLCMPRDDRRGARMNVPVPALPHAVRATLAHPRVFDAQDWVRRVLEAQPGLCDESAPTFAVRLGDIPSGAQQRVMADKSRALSELATFAAKVLRDRIDAAHNPYTKCIDTFGPPDGRDLPTSATELQVAGYVHAMKDCGVGDDECDAVLRQWQRDSSSIAMPCSASVDALFGACLGAVGTRTF